MKASAVARAKKNAISPKACSLLRQIYRLRRGCNRGDRDRDRQGSTPQLLETARCDIALQDPHSGARSQGSVLVFDRNEACTADSYIWNRRQIRLDRKPRGPFSSWRCSSRFREMLRARAGLSFLPGRRILENRYRRCCRMQKRVLRTQLGRDQTRRQEARFSTQMTVTLFRLLRQTTTLLALLLNCLCLSESLAQQSVKTLAQLAREIDANLEILEKNTTPGSEIATSLVEELDEFKQQSVMIFGQRRQQAEERLQQLQRTIDDS